MATFKEALEYAAQNPNSEFAQSFGKEVATGKHDSEARSLGFDTTPIKQKFSQPITPTVVQPKKETFMEKVAGFTGGKQIAQGIGQALANPKIKKQQEQLLNDTIEQQTVLLKRKKEIQTLGGDTTAIDRALDFNRQSLDEISGQTEELLNQKGITGKQVLGSALQLGTTLVGAGTLPGASKAVTSATTFGKGAIEGAKLGAVSGGAYGAASGIASGLEQDKGALEIAEQGISGGLTGAALGGVTGGLLGGITGKVKGAKIAKAKKKEDFVLDLVSPKQTTEYKIQAQKEGRVTDAGLLTPSKIIPGKKDAQLAEVVKDIVDPNLTPQQNLNLIDTRVDDITSNVRAYVNKNKVPFNTNQLTTQLNKGKSELNLIFASDKQAEKTYNAVVKEFIKHVDGKDTSGLLLGRQGFDKIPAIKKLLESQGLGENTKREIVKQVRASANDYVSSLLPKGNKYKEALLNQTRMIDVMDNIAEKNRDRIGRNKIQYLVKKYPWLKTAGYIGLGAIGAQMGIGAIGAATGKGE